MPIKCKMCGTENPDAANNCSACGTNLSLVPNSGAKKTGGMANKTMLFGKAPDLTAQPSAKSQKTSNADVPMVKLTPTAKEVKHAEAKPADVSSKKTMLGAPAVKVETKSEPPMASPVAARTAEPKINIEANKTMIGMPTVNNDDLQKAIESAKNKSKQAKETKDAQKSKPQVSTEQPVEKAVSQPEPRGREFNKETSDDNNKRLKDSFSEEKQDSWEDDDVPASKNKGIKIAIIAALAAVLVFGAIIIFKMLGSGGKSYNPRLEPSEDGTIISVVLDMSDVPADSIIKVYEHEIEISQGKAEFDLPRKQLSLGTNTIEFSIQEPGKSPQKQNFSITLRHSIKNDYSLLKEDPPGVKIIFEVIPEHTILIDGKHCEIKDNICSYFVPIEKIKKEGQADAAGLKYFLPFELSSSQGSEEGKHLINVPLTPLRIDRPAANAIIDVPEITCLGVSQEGATIKVNDKEITASEAGFSTTITLEALGEHTIVFNASVQGKATNKQEIKVIRVENMESYIETWKKDMEAGFDYTQLSRNTKLHAGKKIHLSGRIVNINTEQGVTAFLMYVDEGCPAGGQCGVYVVFRGETNAGLQSRVHVYGVVRGTREVDIDKGDKKILPAIDANFVVEAQAAKKR